MKTQDLDYTPRYTPKFVIIAKVMKLMPVEGVVSYPPGQHPDKCPLVPECVAVELRTSGGSKWYGVKNAYINSELRFVVEGFPRRFKEMSKWEVVPEDRRV
jgi:hypothetical protein